MADAQATFAINLEDGTSGAAASAANALAKLKGQIDGDTKALAQMQRAMKNLQQGSSVNIQQFKDLKAAIEAKKQSIAQAQSSYLSLGGTFNAGGRGAKGLAERFAELTKTSQMMPGPLGGLLTKLGGIKGVLGGGAIALGIVAIAAGLVLLTAASAAASVALFKYGIAQADARRSELLRIEGLTKMRNWMGLAAGNAQEMQTAIDQVSGSVAIGRDKVAEYSTQLYKAGLRGQNLTDALEGVAIKAAVQGEAAASAFAGWAAGAALAGGSVKKLTDDVKARLGGIAAKQMLSLDVQSKKLHESFSALFSGLKIEGFLKALNMVTSLFSQNTASGRALKIILETMFQPLANVAESLGPVIKRFFQGMVIGALYLAIAVLTVRNWFKKTFGSSDILSGFDAQTAALYAGIAAVGLLGAAFVAMGGLIVGALAVATPFIWGAVTATAALAVQGLILAAPFLLGAVAIGALVAAGLALYDLWREIDWSSLGRAIIDGIVGGLESGAQWVIDAVTSLGESAFGAFKGTLGIASPSKEFAKLGVALPQGVEAGIDTGTPALKKSVETMVDVPQVPTTEAAKTPEGSAVPAAAQRGGPISISFGDIVVNSKAETAKEMAADFKHELERVLETVVVQLGATLPGGA